MKTVTNTTKTETNQGNFPSADLINFRFDQNDIAIAKLDQKLDMMIDQIVTPREMAEAKADAAIIHQNIYTRLNKLEGWNDKIVWLIISAVIITVLASIGVKAFIK